jgi:GT2 family glycosyltransferase
MTEGDPSIALEVSVVIPTRGRPERLEALLESLHGQTLAPQAFEVIVVDDGGGAGASVVERERRRRGLELRVITRDRSGGPGAARNDGWRAARASLVAFVDDDCVALPGWLEAGVKAAGRDQWTLVQGRTDPLPSELEHMGPFAHTQRVRSAGPRYQTCNIFYSRALLERLDGFDAESFRTGGEDTDLAWRAIAAGATVRFSEHAQVFHGVEPLGPIAKLRSATRWTETVQLYGRHPELRRTQLTFGVFFTGAHYLLVRALVAIALPRRFWPLRRWLASAYVVHLVRRGREEGGGVAYAPFFLLYDLVELFSVLRGAVRYRTLVL